MNSNIKINHLRNIIILVTLTFLFFSVKPVYAQEQSIDYIYFDDGSKIKVITIIEENTSGITLFTTTKTKNVTKRVNLQLKNNKIERKLLMNAIYLDIYVILGNFLQCWLLFLIII